MLLVDSTLFTLDWDHHGELDQDDRQTLLNLLTQGQRQGTGRPEPQSAHHGTTCSPAVPIQAPLRASAAGVFQED